jgi:hypothetical protein
LIHYDSVLIDTPWCVVFFVRGDNGKDPATPVRGCFADEEKCKRFIEYTDKYGSIVHITAVGECAEESL